MSKTYKGSCHCGTVSFEAQSDLETKGVGHCTCSICHKLNMIAAQADAASFKILSGKESLLDYQFAKKNFHHWFCKNCGVHPYISGSMGGTEMVIVNISCLDNVELNGTKLTTYDGKNDTFAVLKTGTL